jgi:hypothetical protein
MPLAHNAVQARKLIKSKRYVVNSNCGDVQPKAADENAFLKEHSWQEYAGWFLGLTEGAADETKARYAFVYGDFRCLHRSGLIASCTAPPTGGKRRLSVPSTDCCKNSTPRLPSLPKRVSPKISDCVPSAWSRRFADAFKGIFASLRAAEQPPLDAADA